MLKIKQIDHAVLVAKQRGAFAFLHLAILEFLRKFTRNSKISKHF
ncbi:hypothetical protein [Campylobacter sp.]|nr:hypothetical protein [Campylobacter sp.]MDY4446480.1 hypothetical protein [Campylobacter sp.]